MAVPALGLSDIGVAPPEARARGRCCAHPPRQPRPQRPPVRAAPSPPAVADPPPPAGTAGTWNPRPFATMTQRPRLQHVLGEGQPRAGAGGQQLGAGAGLWALGYRCGSTGPAGFSAPARQMPLNGVTRLRAALPHCRHDRPPLDRPGRSRAWRKRPRTRTARPFAATGRNLRAAAGALSSDPDSVIAPWHARAIGTGDTRERASALRRSVIGRRVAPCASAHPEVTRDAGGRRSTGRQPPGVAQVWRCGEFRVGPLEGGWIRQPLPRNLEREREPGEGRSENRPKVGVRGLGSGRFHTWSGVALLLDERERACARHVRGRKGDPGPLPWAAGGRTWR